MENEGLRDRSQGQVESGREVVTPLPASVRPSTCNHHGADASGEPGVQFEMKIKKKTGSVGAWGKRAGLAKEASRSESRKAKQ